MYSHLKQFFFNGQNMHGMSFQVDKEIKRVTWERKTRVEPYDWPSLIHWKFSGHGTGKEESRRRPADSTIWREESKETKAAIIHKTIRGKNSCKERKLWRHAKGIPQEISWGLSTHTWVNYPRRGKSHLKVLEASVPWAPQNQK